MGPCGPLGIQAVILGTISGFSPSNLVLYRLWERNGCCGVNTEYRNLLKSYQSELAPQDARERAKQEFVNRKLLEAPKHCQDEIADAVDCIMRKGHRWAHLIVMAESMEVLLVDEDRYIGDPTTTLGKVIDHGTEEEFEAMNAFLFSEENNFKECCLRLTGVCSMINELKETRKSETRLRAYLVKAIKERIEDVFGPPEQIDDPLEEITYIDSNPLQHAIWSVLGIQVEISSDSPPPDLQLPVGPEDSDRTPVAGNTDDTPSRFAGLSSDTGFLSNMDISFP